MVVPQGLGQVGPVSLLGQPPVSLQGASCRRGVCSLIFLLAVAIFTSRRCRRQGPRNRLLARPGRTWSGSPVFLVLRLLLLCDGLEVRDCGLGGGVCGAALEAGLHVLDALLEGLELGGSGLDDLLSLIDLGIQVSNAVVEAEDVSQFSREGAGDRGLWSAAIGLPVPVKRLV